MTSTPTIAPLLTDGSLDRLAQAQFSQLTPGVSVAALRMAFDDRLADLSHNPGEQAELAQKSGQKVHRLSVRVLQQ